MTLWIRLLSACVCLSLADEQPYKFMPPLARVALNPDVFPASEEAEAGIVAEVPIAESRSGEAAPFAEEDTPLMSSTLDAPDSLPLPEKLVSRSRSRQKAEDKEVEDEEEDEDDDGDKGRVSNHKMEKQEDKVEPRAEPLRLRIPPRPEDEYYYYYDDDEYYYYDDYEDYHDYTRTGDKYPNFPAKPPPKSKPRDYPPKKAPASIYDKPKPTLPEKRPKPSEKKSRPEDSYRKQEVPLRRPEEKKPHDRHRRPEDKYERRPEDKYERRPEDKYSKRPESQERLKKGGERSRAPEDRYRRPEDTPRRKPADESRHRGRRPTQTDQIGFRRKEVDKKQDEYGIEYTLNRIKEMRREKNVHRAGKPSLPNPWEIFNRNTKTSPVPSVKRPDPRKAEKKPASRPSKPSSSKRPRRPSTAAADYYYYDAPPSAPLRRAGASGGGANPLALLVAPLAGIALLTAAAAVAINPVLVTVSLTGRRRKRNAEIDEGISPELEEKIHEMQVLEKFMASVPDNMNYQHQVLSMYLSCSGYTEVSNECLDRVVCEYADPDSDIQEEEKDVISIVLYNIMSNEHVAEDYKERLRMAARQGRDQGACAVYECAQLTELRSNTL